MQVIQHVIIISAVSVFSCKDNNSYLTAAEKKWNPYKKNEILVFESSNNEKDTIYIEDIEYGFPDGPSVITYYEYLRVEAKHSDPEWGFYEQLHINHSS